MALKPETRRRLTLVCSVVVIIASCAWIYFAQVRTAKYNVALHQRIGEVLAEQTAALIGREGYVVTLAIPTHDWPELKTEIDAFEETLRKLGKFEVRDYELDPKGQPKYGVGSGLSGRRYVRTFKKNEQADVFVSFIGAPDLEDEEIAELTKGKKPRLIALARSTDNLPELFRKDLIDIAVVSRFRFPSPAPERPRTPQDWFTQRFQVVTKADVKAMMDES